MHKSEIEPIVCEASLAMAVPCTLHAFFAEKLRKLFFFTDYQPV